MANGQASTRERSRIRGPSSGFILPSCAKLRMRLFVSRPRSSAAASGRSATSWNSRFVSAIAGRFTAASFSARDSAFAITSAAGTTRFTIPSFERAVRIDRLAERDQLERRLAPDLAHEVRHHDRGDDAVLARVADPRAVGHHRDVGRDREPRAAAHGMAVDALTTGFEMRENAR